MEQTTTSAADAKPETDTKKIPTVDELIAERDKIAAALKDANKEAAERRKKLEKFEADEKARAEAAMSETEKLTAKARDLEAQLTAAQTELIETRITSAIEREAMRLGFADANDAALMLDKKAISIDGKNVTGVKEALEALAKAKPYLLKSQQPPSVGSPAKPAQATRNLTPISTQERPITRF